MPKLAIFDLDGTLLDTLGDLANACNHALAANGFPTHPREAYRYFVGSGAHNLILRALAPVVDTASIAKVEAVFHAYYAEHSLDCTRPYDGVVDALAELRRAGWKIAVLSNKPHVFVSALMERFFSGLIDLAIGQREGVPIKPDPMAVREILGHFGCTPREAAFLGDSEVDMHTGGNAGLFTIGVSWGFRTTEELQQNGADVIIDKTSEIVEVLVDNSRRPHYTE